MYKPKIELSSLEIGEDNSACKSKIEVSRLEIGEDNSVYKPKIVILPGDREG